MSVWSILFNCEFIFRADCGQGKEKRVGLKCSVHSKAGISASSSVAETPDRSRRTENWIGSYVWLQTSWWRSIGYSLNWLRLEVPIRRGSRGWRRRAIRSRSRFNRMIVDVVLVRLLYRRLTICLLNVVVSMILNLVYWWWSTIVKAVIIDVGAGCSTSY